MARCWWMAVGLGVALWVAPEVGWTQAPPAGEAPPAAPERAAEAGELGYSDRVDVTEFVPAPPGTQQVSAPLMVTLAYAFIWLLAIAFLATLWRRSRALQTEVETARQRLTELDARLAEQLRKGGGG